VGATNVASSSTAAGRGCFFAPAMAGIAATAIATAATSTVNARLESMMDLP
jgi:hypothetical protein